MQTLIEVALLGKVAFDAAAVIATVMLWFEAKMDGKWRCRWVPPVRMMKEGEEK